jgi:site-specific recombinase XerD
MFLGDEAKTKDKGMKDDIEKLLKDFIEYEKNQGQRSLRKIPYVLGPFFAWLDMTGYEFADINYQKANEYQTHISTLKNEDGTVHYGGSSVYGMVYLSGRLYAYLKTIGKVYVNPFIGIKRVKQEVRLPRNIPNEQKMDELLASLRDFRKERFLWDRRNVYKTHVIAELLYASGLRISEVASLREEDIDFERNIIRVKNGKGGKDRTAYLNDYAARVLKLFACNMRELVNRGKSDTLFGVKTGRLLDSSLNRRLNEYGKKCGIGRFTSHNFRHAIGFHLLRRGCDLRYIQLILGHEELNSTTIYTKVEKGDLRNELDSCHPRRFGKETE